MKRSAEEAALASGGDSGDIEHNKHESESKHPPPPPHASKISVLSSSSTSSSCSIEQPSSYTASSSTTASKSLHRTVTNLSSASIIDANDNSNATSRRQQITRLINARILQQNGTLLHGSMDLSGGLIVGMHYSSDQLKQSSNNDDDDDATYIEIVDCQEKILSPGFVDIQLNGAYGIDFSHDSLEIKDVLHVAERLVETGVTSFCPTMVSSSPRTYRRIISLMRSAREQQQQQDQTQASKNDSKAVVCGANILGMHLEGPFFAMSKSGAHDKQHIVAPVNGIKTVKEVYGIDQEQENSNDGDIPTLKDIDIVTLAPELPGSFDAIQALTSLVVVSCGHTEATYEDGLKAVSCGATLLTHVYNAMNPFHHRMPGLVGLLSSKAKLARSGLNRPFFSIIVDGIHVHESAVCMAYSNHPNGCVLVTDAMAAMGLGDGNHTLGNMKVSIQGDRATLANSDTLAGSVVSLDTCIKRFRQFSGCSIGEALLCATSHPAQVLKRHIAREDCPPIGVLEVGAKADIILLNDEFDVLQVWVSGKLVHQKKNNF